MVSDKLPPHNIDAEEAVIGSLLLGASINGLPLDSGDFYHEPLAIMYSACQAMGERGVKIDQVTLGQQLQERDKLDACGGVAFLSHLISITPTHLDLPHYAEIVHRLALHRMILLAGSKIVSIGYDGGPDVAKSMDMADDCLLEVRRHGVSSPIVEPDERAKMLSSRYDQLYKREGGIAIKTGLSGLDYRLGGGLYRGDLTVLGARPGMGKTTFLQGIANSIGRERNVLFCSAEMGIEGVSDRDVASVLGVPIGVIRLGGYDDETYVKIIGEALEYVSNLNVFYYKDVPLTTGKIAQAALGMKLRRGLDAVFIDYLGMLDDAMGERESQHLRLGNMSRKLKQTAMVVDVPVVVAHQLSRRVEERADKRPQLYDLRESGQIEENADNVLFLYRDSYYADEEGSDDPVTEVLIGKQRQGEANRMVKVFFEKKHQKYTDLAREE